MLDPETKQVIYNPGQTRTQKKDLVVTIAQDVKTEKSSRTSKSESFGLNLGFQNSGIPSLGVNYQKVKINEQRQESHHQMNIVINIPSDCDEGCKKHTNHVFQLVNNALYNNENPLWFNRDKLLKYHDDLHLLKFIPVCIKCRLKCQKSFSLVFI